MGFPKLTFCGVSKLFGIVTQDSFFGFRSKMPQVFLAVLELVLQTHCVLGEVVLALACCQRSFACWACSGLEVFVGGRRPYRQGVAARGQLVVSGDGGHP